MTTTSSRLGVGPWLLLLLLLLLLLREAEHRTAPWWRETSFVPPGKNDTKLTK